MSLKSKLPIILLILVLFGALFYKNSTIRHFFYFSMVKTVVPSLISDVENNDSTLHSNNVQFFDTRSFSEYKASHIPLAIWIGNDDSSQVRFNNHLKPSTKRAVVYCTIGYRSQHTGAKIRDNSNLEVLNLYGGIVAWKRQNKPLIDSNNQATQHIESPSLFWSIFL